MLVPLSASLSAILWLLPHVLKMVQAVESAAGLTALHARQALWRPGPRLLSHGMALLVKEASQVAMPP